MALGWLGALGSNGSRLGYGDRLTTMGVWNTGPYAART